MSHFRRLIQAIGRLPGPTHAARVQGIDNTMTAHGLDVILGPMDGRIPTIAAAAGYPVGTMPLGYSKTNGRPFGMCVVASAGHEDKSLRAMRSWDASIAKTKPTPQMQSSQAAVQNPSGCVRVYEAPLS